MHHVLETCPNFHLPFSFLVKIGVMHYQWFWMLRQKMNSSPKCLSLWLFTCVHLAFAITKWGLSELLILIFWGAMQIWILQNVNIWPIHVVPIKQSLGRARWHPWPFWYVVPKHEDPLKSYVFLLVQYPKCYSQWRFGCTMEWFNQKGFINVWLNCANATGADP